VQAGRRSVFQREQPFRDSKEFHTCEINRNYVISRIESAQDYAHKKMECDDSWHSVISILNEALAIWQNGKPLDLMITRIKKQVSYLPRNGKNESFWQSFLHDLRVFSSPICPSRHAA